MKQFSGYTVRAASLNRSSGELSLGAYFRRDMSTVWWVSKIGLLVLWRVLKQVWHGGFGVGQAVKNFQCASMLEIKWVLFLGSGLFFFSYAEQPRHWVRECTIVCVCVCVCIACCVEWCVYVHVGVSVCVVCVCVYTCVCVCTCVGIDQCYFRWFVLPASASSELVSGVDLQFRACWRSSSGETPLATLLWRLI